MHLDFQHQAHVDSKVVFFQQKPNLYDLFTPFLFIHLETLRLWPLSFAPDLYH